MKNSIHILILLFLSITISAQDGFGPIHEPVPCPTNTTVKQYCFTNTSQNSPSGEYNCPMRICLVLRYTPHYLGSCEILPHISEFGGNIANKICITLNPGESQCIDVPVPSLPVNQWYDMDVEVSGLANPGQGGSLSLSTVGPGSTTTPVFARGGCGPESNRYFLVSSPNGSDYNIWFAIWPR